MIPIFDLDDTLYDERSFVLSGFRAVAEFGNREWGIPPGPSVERMTATLDREGRGRVFDDWLEANGRHARANVRACVKVYRHHRPDIALPERHRSLLRRLAAAGPIFLVTDGHKIAQGRKVEALDLAPLFRRIYITHRYGIRHAKPSLHCFELIRKLTGAEWAELAYIGDNPAKDFVSLNRVGATTIRVHTGAHRDAIAAEGYDAGHHIDTLAELEPLLARLG
ncbi:HAD hydrolase-like protein [Rhodobacterales bacterium HKCCE2091]|nr:HAD hydrolase-like protein [Rhodobacterales bacterium HKCCE2091]